MLAVADAGSGTGAAVGVAVAVPPAPLRGTVDEPPLHPAASIANSINAPASRFRLSIRASVGWRAAA
jgi:hypothetical protein